MKTLTKTQLKNITYQFTGACIEVHKALGPGLLERVYHDCLKHELALRKIHFESEIHLPVNYKGIAVETLLRCDFMIERTLLVELKSVEAILPIHEAQLLTYLKLLQAPKGLLVNFNVVNLYHDGIKSFVTEHFRNIPD